MSWWFSQRTKTGKQVLWLIDVDPIVVLLAIGFVAALLLPNILYHPESVAKGSLGLMIIGLLCILVAKVSLFRRGIWLS